MAELERESLAKLAELETELGALKVEYADALEARRLVEEELTALKRQRQDSARRQSVLENKIIELETLTGTLTKGSSGKLSVPTNLPTVPMKEYHDLVVDHFFSKLSQCPLICTIILLFGKNISISSTLV